VPLPLSRTTQAGKVVEVMAVMGSPFLGGGRGRPATGRVRSACIGPGPGGGDGTLGAVSTTSSRTAADKIIWVDCEMTGLDKDADALVEIAVLVTDGDLNVLGDGVDVVVRPPASALEQMDDFVRTMHT